MTGKLGSDGSIWSSAPQRAQRAQRLFAEDKKTIAALDTQYQLAVKENDAATMDRILADDFILVTGSGKTYSKADLLAEARSGRASTTNARTIRIRQFVFGLIPPSLPPC
jgi:hypothetical protein